MFVHVLLLFTCWFMTRFQVWLSSPRHDQLVECSWFALGNESIGSGYCISVRSGLISSNFHYSPNSPRSLHPWWLSHVVARCPTLSHIVIVPRCPALSRVVPRCPTLSHVVPRCPTLSHVVPRCPTLSHVLPLLSDGHTGRGHVQLHRLAARSAAFPGGSSIVSIGKRRHRNRR